LIGPLGMMGAALATASSLVLFNLVKMFVVYKLTGLHPFEKTYVRILMPFVPIVGLLILYRALAWGNFLPGLLIMAFFSIGIYLFVLFYKGFTPGDKKIFLSLVPGTAAHARDLQREKP